MNKAAPSRRTQGGTVSVLAVLMLGLVLSVAALALDIGHMYWVKRDMQKAADLAALSAATDLANALSIAQRVALANGFDCQDADSQSSLTATMGYYDFNAQPQFAQKADVAQANAVQVTLNRTVKYFFLPGEYQAPAATAVAMRQPIAGFSLGSFIARVGSTDPNLINGVLGGLLGGTVALDLLSYQGLAAADVSLQGLRTALGLGTVNELLAANLTLEQLLDAAISALNAQGDTSAALSLGQLQAAVSAALPPIALGDLLKVAADDSESADTAQVNVLQLITMAAQIANVNSGSLIKVPSLGVTIPPVLGIVGASTSLAMTMIDKPSIAIGPAMRDGSGNWVTRAHSGQLRVRLNVALKVNLLSLVGLDVNLPLYIEGGGANGDLTAIQCKVPKNDSEVTIQTHPQLLAAYIGTVGDGAMSDKSSPVTVSPAVIATVKILLINIPISAQSTVPLEDPGQELKFNGPFDYNNTKTTAGNSLGLGGLLNSNIQLSSPNGLTGLVLGLLSPILTALLSLLGGVLGLLDGLLIDPLLSLLGIELGGGDVTAFYLDCAAPRLVR